MFSPSAPTPEVPPPAGPERLRVRVNDELVIDAGTCEPVSRGDNTELWLRPPQTTLFHQVLDYLRSKPDPKGRKAGSAIGRAGAAAGALVLRWGSYLCVLADRDKPLWSAAGSDGVSCISDGEMARINIEASAALAEWVDLYREHPKHYLELVERAVTYLPMPRKTSIARLTPFTVLADPAYVALLVRAVGQEQRVRVQLEAERRPSRLFANALVNVAWRNGPVERIHAGIFGGFPLDRCRITPDNEQRLMRFASDGLALGMRICQLFAEEHPRRPWAEQVLPYGLANLFGITPSRWTLTEATREVWLPTGGS